MTSDAPRLNLHNRLTSVADSELSVLLASLSTLHLDPSLTDARFFRGTTNVRFSTALCYSRVPSLTCRMMHLLAPFGIILRPPVAGLFFGLRTTVKSIPMSVFDPVERTTLASTTSVAPTRTFLIFYFTAPGHKISGSCSASNPTTSPLLNFFGPLTSLGLLFLTRLCAQPLPPASCGMFGSAGTPRFSA